MAKIISPSPTADFVAPGRVREQIFFPKQGKTKQSFRDETLTRNILKRNPVLPDPRFHPEEVDVSQVETDPLLRQLNARAAIDDYRRMIGEARSALAEAIKADGLDYTPSVIPEDPTALEGWIRSNPKAARMSGLLAPIQDQASPPPAKPPQADAGEGK